MFQNTTNLIEHQKAALAVLAAVALLFVGIGSAEAAPAPQEITPPAPATISVRAPTHCRTGQGIPHEIVYTMLPGTIARVLQGDGARGYWLIEVPDHPGRTCWLWGYYARLSGDAGSITYAATPTPSGLAYSLSEPRNLTAGCSAEVYADDGDDEINDPDDASAWTVDLHWTNTDPNQTGVVLYRFGRRIAFLTPGSRSYTDYFIHYDDYHGAQYGVQAVGLNAVSSIVWTYMNSCR